MGHRREPNWAETVRVMRIMADVAALRADPAAQRQVLVDGLHAVLHSSLSWFLVLDGARLDRPVRPALAVLPADTDGFWQRYLAVFGAAVPAAEDPFVDRILPCDDAAQHWTLKSVMPDRAARRRFAAAAELTDHGGIGTGGVTVLRRDEDRTVSLSVFRTVGDRPFAPRDGALQRFAMAEVGRLIDRGHLSLGPPPAGGGGLPPRLQQVLDGIKVGQAPKVIARDLGLSVWTVRDHIKRLYAKYDVRGRDELMARFIDGGG